MLIREKYLSKIRELYHTESLIKIIYGMRRNRKSVILNQIKDKLLKLKNHKINYCLGCNTCQRNGGTCIYKDDVSKILEKMIKTDIIVLASPIYFYSISDQMKTLIDRSYAKYNLLSNKIFYFILSCSVPYEEPYKDNYKFS
mgnify:CR=1 FL=1